MEGMGAGGAAQVSGARSRDTETSWTWAARTCQAQTAPALGQPHRPSVYLSFPSSWKQTPRAEGEVAREAGIHTHTHLDGSRSSTDERVCCFLSCFIKDGASREDAGIHSFSPNDSEASSRMEPARLCVRPGSPGSQRPEVWAWEERPGAPQAESEAPQEAPTQEGVALHRVLRPGKRVVGGARESRARLSGQGWKV